MTGVQHSGFVRFDHNQEIGYVAAQFPTIEELLYQKVQLHGVPAEEILLRSEEPLVINDVAASEQLDEVRELLLRFDIQSLCIVKVKMHGNVIGSFSFDSIGRKREFNARDIALCKSFAELASSKIEQTAQDDWLSAFHRATAALHVEKEAAPLLKAIIKHAEILFKAQTVGLYLRRPDANREDSLHMVASSTEELTGRTLKKGEGMAWQLIMSGEPYMCTSDYQNYEHRADTFEGKFGSVLEVPLLRQHERIGVLYLSDVRGRAFTPFDADHLQKYADSAISAIEHCNLIARMRDLSIASAEMSSSADSLTLSAKLKEIARNATIILNAEMCGVFFRDENDGETLVLKASFGHADDSPNTGRWFEIKDEPRSGLTGALAARFIASHANGVTRKTLGAKDERPVIDLCGRELLTDPAVRGGEKDATPGGTCHSIVAVPLIQKRKGTEEVTGILRVSNKKGIDGRPGNTVCFSEEDKLVLRVFTETAVVSVESATLAEKSQRLLKALADKNYRYLKSLDQREENEENLKELVFYNIKAGIVSHHEDKLVHKLTDELVHRLREEFEQFEKTFRRILAAQEFSPDDSRKKDRVFISYSHKDKKFVEELLTHLKPLERAGRVSAWSDKQIQPGAKWLDEIRESLAASRVAVMMVTADFLASDFIYEFELGPLLKIAETGGSQILWIPVRACSYKESPLKNYQAVIPPEKPLAEMKAERDQAWVRICDEIKTAANK
jgi:GAF domain-containing protein